MCHESLPDRIPHPSHQHPTRVGPEEFGSWPCPCSAVSFLSVGSGRELKIKKIPDFLKSCETFFSRQYKGERVFGVYRELNDEDAV